MNVLFFLALLTVCVLLSPLAIANDPTVFKGCAAKKHALQTRIEQASAHNNSHQQAGLQTALDHVNVHCSDESLRQERENKVKAAKREVSERQADLNAAIKKGDPDKISKRKAKLAESRYELQGAQDELDK